MSSAEPKGFACPICASDRARFAAEHHSLRVARCLDCGHGYVWPVPSPEFLDSIYRDESYYEGSEDSIGFRDYASLEPARKRMFARHLARIEGDVRPGRILDVGGANGDFLKVARDRGWQVFGADPSAARAQVEAAGIQLVGTTVHDAKIEDGSLDAVTCWDVLEHVTDPVADLTRTVELLKPDAVVALTVPDSADFLARVSGRRWFGYKTASERGVLRQAGGRARRVRPPQLVLPLRGRGAAEVDHPAGQLGPRAGLRHGQSSRRAAAIARHGHRCEPADDRAGARQPSGSGVRGSRRRELPRRRGVRLRRRVRSDR